jgi:hypothetical protein
LSEDALNDSANRAVDFAFENDIVTKHSLFLLGSSCPEHQTKGLSVQLSTNYDDVMSSRQVTEAFHADLKKKLSQVHCVRPNGAFIVLLTHNSPIEVHYSVTGGVKNIDNSEVTKKAYELYMGGQHVNHRSYSAIRELRMSQASFDPIFNRDFSLPANCPEGQNRGGFPYYPPKGSCRFALAVSGKFKNKRGVVGDTWLGEDGSPGEWTVAYHGTKQ